MDKNIDMKNKKNKENPLPLMKRLLGYILKNYKFSCIAVLAVSYTHLDVYKRQEYGYVKGFL